MRIFVTDATGYIGLNVSTTFRRAGYQVFGLVQNQEKVSLLERNEIIPVIGSLQKPECFKNIVGKCEVIIHNASGNQGDTDTLDLSAVRLLLEMAQDSSQSRSLIYTSSIWVFGDSKNQQLTEQSPYSPPQKVARLPEIEQMVLNAGGMRGLVIRPGVVYGKAGGYTGMWFQGASNGGVAHVVGDGQNRWAMVHVDDLARGYLLAAQSNLRGESFNLVDSTHSTVLAMVSAAARAAGNISHLELIPKDSAAKKMGTLAEALALDQIVEADKACQMLSWRPQHKGFVREVDTYYRAWQAGQSSR